MRNRIICLLIIALMCPLFAQIDLNQARIVAESFITEKQNVRFVHRQNEQYSLYGDYTITRIVPFCDNHDESILCYIAELDPCGYVVITTNRNIRPVLAYSFDSEFVFELTSDNLPLSMILADIVMRTEAIPYISQYILERNNRLWDRYLNGDRSFSITIAYGPFLDTRWNQGAPFNNLCPIDPETGDRSVVGCTATSMAQIINYWEYPNSVYFDSTHSYWSDSTTPPIWIDATTATAESICYNGSGVHPDAANKAAISWACGVSMYAIYGSEGTIAWFHDSAFTDIWGYVSAEKVDPPDMTDFYDRLDANIMSAQPAQLGIFWFDPPDTSGHAIVCDGLMDSGEYHLNYGWGGYTDGWYFLPEGIPDPFDIVRWAIIDIAPPDREDGADLCGDAAMITSDDTEKILNDAIIPVGDVDWFCFYASEESTYVFYTTGMLDTYGEVYECCGGELLLSDDDTYDGSNFKLMFHPDSSGEYYLKIYSIEPDMFGLFGLRYFRTEGPYIIIETPNGGEVIDAGTSAFIQWIRGGSPAIPRLDFEYSLHGIDGPWVVIADSIPSSGFYVWNVPDMDSVYDDSYLRILDSENGNVLDISDSPFTIRGSSSITSIQKPVDATLSIYPNPFNGAVRIQFENVNGNDIDVEVYNIYGQRIFEDTIHKNLSSNYSWSWQPDDRICSGIYLLKASIQGKDIYRKLNYLK